MILERRLLDETERQLATGKMNDPSRAAANISKVKQTAIDKLLALTGRPTTITQHAGRGGDHPRAGGQGRPRADRARSSSPRRRRSHEPHCGDASLHAAATARATRKRLRAPPGHPLRRAVRRHRRARRGLTGDVLRLSVVGEALPAAWRWCGASLVHALGGALTASGHAHAARPHGGRGLCLFASAMAIWAVCVFVVRGFPDGMLTASLFTGLCVGAGRGRSSSLGGTGMIVIIAQSRRPDPSSSA
jgi:hypothetical protein